MGNKLKYNLDILDYVSTRDNANILIKYDKINTKTPIQFRCSCGTEYSKTLIRIVENGGLYCKS